MAEALGRLPLALEQAAAYVAENGASLAAYLALFIADPTLILDDEGAPHEERRLRATVATTWRITLGQLERTAPATADLLRLCAFLGPEAIPEELLRAAAPHLPAGSPLAMALAKPARVEAALGAAHRYSLLERGELDGRPAVSVHRLLQLVVREGLAESARAIWARAAVALVNEAFPDPEYATWGTCARLVPHGLAAMEHAERTGEVPDGASRLLHEMGVYLRTVGAFDLARDVLERAQAIMEARLGPDHPDVATSLNNLAAVLRDQGDLAEARGLLERALAIWTRREDDINASRALSALADVAEQAGDLLGAMTWQRRQLALAGRQSTTYGEGLAFYRLGILAAQLGRPEAGLRLLAVSYAIDRALGLQDAEATALPEVRSQAEHLGFDEEELAAMLAEAEAAYRRDRGASLVAEAFPDSAPPDLA